jgi:carbon-monoxide dehydrogenase large subunit
VIPPPPVPGGPLGRSFRRREDARLLTGDGAFLDDIASPPSCLHAVFVRSPHAHARIGGIIAAAALAVPGVVSVLTGAALGRLVAPLRVAPPIEGLHPMEMPVLPVEAARFVGDPVALVLAETRRAAEDAAELVEVAWDPLPAISSIAMAATPNAQPVDPALPGNRVSHQDFATAGLDAAFARADRIVQARFGQHRQTHAPLEPRGVMAIWDRGRRHLTIRSGTQAPHPYRSAVAARLALPESQVTVDSPEMGGGFGQKIIPLREDLCVAAAAIALNRPVRWRETRGENLMAALQAREETVVTEAAVAADGRILGLRCRMEADFGAWSFFPANYMARVVALILPGPYRIREYGYAVDVWLTNKCPAGPMRAPMAITSWVMEGTMDAIARNLGLDPLVVRRRNSLTPEDLPYLTATGERYASLSPLTTLEAATAALGYEELRARQPAEGRLLGLGICTVVESTTYGSAFYRAAGIAGSGHEVASLRVEPSGAIIASCGLMGSGQGYETTLAQAAAAGLGAAFADVLVRIGHTDIAPYGMGSRGSRGAAAGGGALYMAGLKLREKLLAIAAAMLGLNTAEGLEMREGKVLRQLGDARSETGLTLAQLARVAHLDPLRLPPGMEPGLHQILAFDPPTMTYSNSSHACALEIDQATGAITILRHVIAEDSGTLINPMVVEGQTHGATAMGLSGAMLEHAAYGEDGQALAGSFMDYAIARASDLPAFEVSHHGTPAEGTPAGIKGMAEGGTMGGIGAVMNAVNDALSRLGARLDSQPATPARIWAALQAARGKEGAA